MTTPRQIVACMVEIDYAMLARLLQLPEGAHIQAAYPLASLYGVLQLQVVGMGNWVSEGMHLPIARATLERTSEPLNPTATWSVPGPNPCTCATPSGPDYCPEHAA